MQAIVENKNAYDLFAETEKNAKDNIDDYMTVVKELLVRNEYNTAETFLIIVKEKFNDNVRVLYNLGIISIVIGKLEEAEKYLKRAVEGGYITNKSLTSYAYIEKLRGNNENALKLLERASKLDKKKLIPRMVFFVELFEQNKYHRAVDLLEEFQTEYPDNYGLYHAEFKTLVEAKEYERALSRLDNIKEQFKDHRGYVCDYVLLLVKMKKYEDAWEYFQENDELIATKQQSYLQLKARIVSGLKMKDETLNCFLRLYEKNSSVTEALNIAILLLMDGKTGEADEYLKEIMKKNEDGLITYIAYYMHAKCLSIMNAENRIIIEAYKKAVDILEKAYEKDIVGVFTTEFAADCYGCLGDMEKQKICTDRMNELKKQLAIS